MLTITHISTNKTVTPMPSSEGLFGDITNPNSPALHCALIRVAQALGIDYPILTETEYNNAVTTQLSDKINWEFPPIVSDAEVNFRMSINNEKISGLIIPSPLLTFAEVKIEIQSEKDVSYAKTLVDSLISSGFLVTDLDIVDVNGNLIHNTFLSQFTTTVV